MIAAVVSGGLSGGVSLAGTILALKIHFRYLRRDVDQAHARIDRQRDRVDGLVQRVSELK